VLFQAAVIKEQADDEHSGGNTLTLLPHNYEQLQYPQFTTGLTLQRNKNKYLEI